MNCLLISPSSLRLYLGVEAWDWANRSPTYTRNYTNEVELGEALREAHAHLKRRSVTVLLSDFPIAVTQLTAPRVADAEQLSVLEIEVADFLPQPVDRYYWDVCLLSQKNFEVSYLLCTVEQTALDPVLKALDTAALKVTAVQPMLEARISPASSAPAIDLRPPVLTERLNLKLRWQEWAAVYLLLLGAVGAYGLSGLQAQKFWQTERMAQQHELQEAQARAHAWQALEAQRTNLQIQHEALLSLRNEQSLCLRALAEVEAVYASDPHRWLQSLEVQRCARCVRLTLQEVTSERGDETSPVIDLLLQDTAYQSTQPSVADKSQRGVTVYTHYLEYTEAAL